jgi:hypothetical protein
LKKRPKTWKFELYVAGDSPRSGAARANLERICRAAVGDCYAIEIFDLLEHPGSIESTTRNEPPEAQRG